MRTGAIFDMDGLLFDTEKVYKNSWREAAKFFGKERGDELADSASGRGGNGCRELIREFYPEVSVDEFFNHVVETAQKVFAAGVDMMPGVVEILKFFKANGVKTAVASSSEDFIVEQNLTRAGIAEYFDAIVGGNCVARGKPAPDIFLKAAESIGVAPTNCYVFEDSYNGLRGAKAAGCAPIMIPDTSPPTDEMRQICAGIYPSLLDALTAIQTAKI